jgi:hypothetical protein
MNSVAPTLASVSLHKSRSCVPLASPVARTSVLCPAVVKILRGIVPSMTTSKALPLLPSLS